MPPRRDQFQLIENDDSNSSEPAPATGDRRPVKRSVSSGPVNFDPTSFTSLFRSLPRDVSSGLNAQCRRRVTISPY